MRYKFYNAGDGKIIVTSTYAGRTVRGTAKCAPGDSYSEEAGKNLALARCDSKVAHKRHKHALKRYQEALDWYDEAYQYLQDMERYCDDSYDAMVKADNELNDILTKM